jgi:site-specific DNA-cytosine methylase
MSNQAVDAGYVIPVEKGERSTEESECLTPWDHEPKRIHPEEGTAPTLAGSDGQGGQRMPYVAYDLRNSAESEQAQTLQGGGQGEGRGRCINAIPHVAGTLTNFKRGLRGNANEADFLIGAVNTNEQGSAGSRIQVNAETSVTLQGLGGGMAAKTGFSTGVRRLTPTECERLQGFPDGWTAVEKPNGQPMSDSARYRMLGNAVGVPVVEWIGRRIMDEEKKCKT